MLCNCSHALYLDKTIVFLYTFVAAHFLNWQNIVVIFHYSNLDHTLKYLFLSVINEFPV
jgi:hypothetical protein